MVGLSVPMNVPHIARVALATCVLAFAGASAASAAIVVMTSGRTLSVKGHETSGDTVVLTLRSGGQVTCDLTLIERFLPDEVPHPDPEPPQARAQEPSKAPAADRGPLLRDSIYEELIAAAAQTHGVDPVLV